MILLLTDMFYYAGLIFNFNKFRVETRIDAYKKTYIVYTSFRKYEKLSLIQTINKYINNKQRI